VATTAPVAQTEDRAEADPVADRVGWGHKLSVLAGLVVPALGVPALAWILTHNALSVSEIVLMEVAAALYYLVGGFGITVGYHRHFTHRSFKAPNWVRYGLAVAAATALQGPIIRWVADHRKHHDFSDEIGDPHSPHGHGLGKVAGFFHAHMGWLFKNAKAPAKRYAKDLEKDPFMRWISDQRIYLLIVLVSLFGFPAAIGVAIHGGLDGALDGIVWIGLVRTFFLLQFTFCINSVCHCFGKQTFQTDDESRDVWWLRWLTLGESNHNAHHAFPTSFRHGLRGGIDLSALFILALEKVGLAKELVRVSPEEQTQKLKVRTAP